MTARSKPYGATGRIGEEAGTTSLTLWREIGRLRLAALAALLLAHVLISAFMVAPGHFVSDEGIYHQMARAFAENGSLTLWPEYAEFPSPELRTWNHVTGKDGSLQSQYPYLHPVLAWPFYELAGFRGLFAMNAIAYVALAGFCFLLGNSLWRSPRVSADGVILLTLGSYAWQYSQAAWSQSLAGAFLLSGVYFGVRSVQADQPRNAILYAWAAGMAVGFGSGIRLDVFFMAPALFIPLLYDRTPRWRDAAAVAVGLLPGLLLLAATNYAKFGTLNPLSYGRSAGPVSISGYIPLLAMGFLALGAAWIGSRETVWRNIVRHRQIVAATGLIVMAGLLFLAPSVSAPIRRLAHGAWILVADLSLYEPSVGGIAVTRGPAGSIMYAETVKKALLQSLPWLPVMLLPIALTLRNRAALFANAIPILTVLAFLAVYGWQAWHGGYAFNLRYFAPVLPIFALYAAMGIHMLRRDGESPRLSLAAILVAVVAGAAWLFMLFRDTEIEAIEAVTLNLPLLLAGILSILLMLSGLWRNVMGIRHAAFLATFACIAWAFVMALLMDFPRTWFLQKVRYDTGVFLATHVPQNTTLFSVYDPASFALTEVPGTLNVWVSMDDYRDSRQILDMNLTAGRSVMAFFGDEDWVEFQRHGMLDEMKAVEVAKTSHATLYRLEPAENSANGQTQ